jgi:hypothetical protein
MLTCHLPQSKSINTVGMYRIYSFTSPGFHENFQTRLIFETRLVIETAYNYFFNTVTSVLIDG